MTAAAAAHHRAVLECLLGLPSAHRVYLVSRLYNDELLGGASAAACYFFLPDLHLTSNTAAERYQYGFTRIDRHRAIDRERLLDDLCAGLVALRERAQERVPLRTVQLGDFLDFWRENDADEDIATLADRILTDHSVVRRYLSRNGRGTLRAKILIGNHERWNHRTLAASTVVPGAVTGQLLTVGSKQPVLATHGDLFDPIERLPFDRLAAWFVDRFGPLIKASECELDRSQAHGLTPGVGGVQGGPPLLLDDPAQSDLLPDWVNLHEVHADASDLEIEQSHGLLRDAIAYADRLRAADPVALNQIGYAGAGPLTQLRAIVIGHSHHPRISLYRDAAHPERNLVLADCGAWIESCKLPGIAEPVPSCHLGVLCGGDLRLYALVPKPELITAI